MMSGSNEDYRQPTTDPRDRLAGIEQGGLRLNADSAEYFEVGYEAAGATFDPNRSTLENVTAALKAQAERGDEYAPNQGGFVLGVLAAVEDLAGGQE